jgi:glycosyltransferase involved in cell wall biosynthesis
VEDGKSGFIIPPASPDDLARTMLRLIEDHALALSMGDYAKHLSDTRFSWDSIAQKIVTIYKSELEV